MEMVTEAINRYGQLEITGYISVGNNPGDMGSNLTAVNFGSGFIPVQLSVSSHHACAVAASGDAACWGSNWQGQLGANYSSDDPSNVPLDVEGVYDIVYIMAGSWATCALDIYNDLRCWGANVAGQVCANSCHHDV